MKTADAAFFALSDSTRRALLKRLARGEATVVELAEPFDMSQPAVSRHLKVLEAAGMISRRVDGTRRPCRLEPAGFQAIDRWLDLMRKAMDANDNRLDHRLSANQPAPTPEDLKS